MKKVIIGVLLIGIAVIVLAPFANGLIMEKASKKANADLNKMYGNTGSDITFDIIDYDRSFSSSSVKWKISLGKLSNLYGIEEIIITDQVKHGYTGVVSKSSLTENKWFNDFIDQQLNGKNPLDITTRCNLLGKVKTTLALDAFSINNDQGTVNILPANIEVAFNKGLNAISSTGSWQGMAIADQLKLDGITFDSTFKKHSTYIWVGDGSFKLASCKATGKEDETLEMVNLTCTYKMDHQKEDDTISLGLDYGIDGFAFEEKRINNGFIRLGINRIDAQGLETFMALYTDIINKSMESAFNDPDDPEKAEAMMQQQMMARSFELISAIEKILKDGLEIKVSDLKVTLPEGDVKGNISLSLNQDMTMAQFAPIVAQPKVALDIFSLNSDLTLPAVLIGDNPAMLSPIYPGMQTGLFELNGEQVVHKAETKDGKLFLNGKEVLLN